MRGDTRKKLEAAGWRVGDAAEFLDLTEAEKKVVEIKLALAEMLRSVREEKQLTQEQLAKRIRSSQSRVAKMEAGDMSVSMDLLVKSLFAAGADQDDVARVMSSRCR